MSETTVILDMEHQGMKGKVELDFLEWKETAIEIGFTDRVYDNAGTIRFDGKTANATITSQKAYAGALEDPAEYNQYFGSILNVFSSSYTFGWSPAPDQMIAYDEDYHDDKGYITGDPKEIEIKEIQAQIIREIADPRKSLVAGCSNGEIVRQCRQGGLDVYGFDVIQNLHEVAFPEVRDYLRVGSLTEIPFDRDDAFDTLIAVDVLEHIPERELPHMIEEWIRLDVRQLVLLINLNQFWYPGHITLRPLDWWADQWKEQYRLVRTVRRLESLPLVYSNSGLYNQQWTVWARVGSSQ